MWIRDPIKSPPMAMQFNIEPTVLNGFLLWAAIVLAKTMAMSFATATTRFRKLAFSNLEDIKGRKDAKLKFDDPDVERVRRCHLNDLENVYLFVLAALLYCFIRPSPTIALWHFRIFGVSRIAHTISYLFQVPQPARALSFAFGAVVCASMIIQVILNAL